MVGAQQRGQIIALRRLCQHRWSYGSPNVSERYNGVSAMEIVGEGGAGQKSTGDAMAAIEQMVKQLPEGIGIEWTGSPSRSVRRVPRRRRSTPSRCWWSSLSGGPSTKSWSIPFSVMLVGAAGVLGAILAATLRGLAERRLTQVGLLTTSGSRPRTPSSSWSSPRS